MNNRYVLRVRFGEERPVRPYDSNSSREDEKFDAGLSKYRSGPLF
jgi:hypothetical protein